MQTLWKLSLLAQAPTVNYSLRTPVYYWKVYIANVAPDIVLSVNRSPMSLVLVRRRRDGCVWQWVRSPMRHGSRLIPKSAQDALNTLRNHLDVTWWSVNAGLVFVICAQENGASSTMITSDAHTRILKMNKPSPQLSPALTISPKHTPSSSR